jgi:hypothetical protein
MLPLREAIEFPFRSENWPRKLGLGAVLSAFPVLSFTLLGMVIDLLKSSLLSAPLGLVYFLVWGYAFHIFRGGLQREAANLLGWDNWRSYLSKGLALFLIQLGYGLLPLLIVALGVGMLYRGRWWFFTGMLLMLMGLLCFLLVGFFYPMGMAHFARWGRIEAAFHLPSLWRGIREVLVEYVSLFLLSLLVLLALGLVAAIPFVGLTLSFFLSFYPLLVLSRLFGEVCALATEGP